MKTRSLRWPAVGILALAAIAMATVPYELVAGLHGAGGSAAGSEGLAVTADSAGVLGAYLVAVQLLVAGGYLVATRRFGPAHDYRALALGIIVSGHAFAGVTHILQEGLDALALSTVALGAVAGIVFLASLLPAWRRVRLKKRVGWHVIVGALFVAALAVHVTVGIYHAVSA